MKYSLCFQKESLIAFSKQRQTLLTCWIKPSDNAAFPLCLSQILSVSMMRPEKLQALFYSAVKSFLTYLICFPWSDILGIELLPFLDLWLSVKRLLQHKKSLGRNRNCTKALNKILMLETTNEAAGLKNCSIKERSDIALCNLEISEKPALGEQAAWSTYKYTHTFIS